MPKHAKKEQLVTIQLEKGLEIKKLIFHSAYLAIYGSPYNKHIKIHKLRLVYCNLLGLI